MSLRSDFVGRLAQLRGIVSKPELNEVFVLIQAYLPEKDRFSVQTLPSPSGNADAVNIAVKLDSLSLCSQDHFASKYPRLRELQVVSFDNAVNEQPDGTTLNLTSLRHPEGQPDVFLANSYRCVGVKAASSSPGRPNPVTKYAGYLRIVPTSEDATLEFEDIHFTGFKDNNQAGLTFFRGHFTTFRRCVFSNIKIQVSGNAPMSPIPRSSVSSRQAQIIDGMLGTPNVVFENCVMNSTVVSADYDGTVTLLNCVLRNCRRGVLTTEGSRVVMKHCLIENCEIGVLLLEKTISCDLSNCTVLNSTCGIVTSVGGPATITGCRVENCERIGVYLRGQNKRANSTTINHCHIARCKACAYIDDGEFVATINDTVLRDSTYGMVISPAAMGSVRMNQCRFMENERCNIGNSSPAKGLLVVDGVVLKEAPVEFDAPESLAAQRCGQRAGLCDIHCLNCGRKEEAGEKFKKCGKCEDVCYCSKACQKTHWKEHKKTCKQLDLPGYAEMISELKRFQEGTSTFKDLSELAEQYM